jgi:hypothetical protein
MFLAFNIIMVTAVQIMVKATNSRFNDCDARHASGPNPAMECQSDWESDSVRAYLMLPIAVMVDVALIAVLLIRKHFRMRQ